MNDEEGEWNWKRKCNEREKNGKAACIRQRVEKRQRN